MKWFYEEHRSSKAGRLQILFKDVDSLYKKTPQQSLKRADQN
jgi:hypothetical protein